MILDFQNVNKHFGDQVIATSASFHIEEKEKAALIGINGAGKTTILRMIIGQEPIDEGDIILSKGKSIGYLAQNQKTNDELSIIEEVRLALSHLIEMEEQIRKIEQTLPHLVGAELDKTLAQYHRLVEEFERNNGYAYRSELIGVLKGLGFTEEEFDKPTAVLSGGEKTRVALGKILLSKPDLLLLDEPTNHLDLNSIAWLETYLLNYKGAVLIVSHDRYFLNRIVTKVVEVEAGEVMMYAGNYHDYAMKKQHFRDAKMKEYLNQQREIKHQEAVITKLKQFNREKSIKRAESREKLLSKIERLDKPQEIDTKMHFQLSPQVTSGNDVLAVEGLKKSFSNRTLFSQLCFEIKRGERVAIIGDNGTGKTTLLKILNNSLAADEGFYRLGTNVYIGYYDQEHALLDASKSIFDEISDTFPDLNNTKIRNTLAAFAFTGDDVYKRIGDLSGGEKGRVSLAKLMLGKANFLILDEPTNHLDITSKEILENALNDYEGTLLYVSHDRYFINQTATRILELTGQQLYSFLGNYDDYLEKKELVHAQVLSLQKATRQVSDHDDITQGEDLKGATNATGSAISWKEQKEAAAKERKRIKDLERTELRIHQLEERDQEIDALLGEEEVYTNSSQVASLAEEKAQIAETLLELMATWEELAES